jgi:hypothetical protein
MTPRPGDLVTLKYRSWYVGVDLATNRLFRVSEGSIGIFIGNFPVPNLIERYEDLVLTNERTVRCAPRAWIVLHEAR